MSEPDPVGLWLCLRALASNGANEVRARGFSAADVPPGPGFVAEVLELGGGLSLEVVVRSRPVGLPVVSDPAEVATPLAPAPVRFEPVPDHLTNTKRDILKAATEREVTRAKLIHLSGHPVNAHTYAVVRALLAAGRLCLGPKGGVYRAPPKG